MGILWKSIQTRQLSFYFVSRKTLKKKTTMAAELDMMNRDPNNINPHLKVGFEDIFGEPEDIRSMECVWKNSYKCFECWKQLCYTIMTFCCGICIAMEWGCEFRLHRLHTHLVCQPMLQVPRNQLWMLPEIVRPLRALHAGSMVRGSLSLFQRLQESLTLN